MSVEYYPFYKFTYYSGKEEKEPQKNLSEKMYSDSANQIYAIIQTKHFVLG
jgi:hypothetical protein